MVPTPIVEQKPTYTVQHGEVAKSLKMVGRVSRRWSSRSCSFARTAT